MTDDERAAREWMKEWAALEGAPISSVAERARYARTILRLLDRPICPKGSEVPMPVLEKMSEAYWKVPTNDCGNDMRAAIDALHAHLTAPPPKKKVERWLVLDSDGDLLGVYRSLAEAGDENWTGDYSIVHMVEAADADQ